MAAVPEKHEESTRSDHNISRSNSTGDTIDGGGHRRSKEWAPIRPTQSRSIVARTASRGSRPLSLHRTRSQNGYGCDDNQSVDNDAADVEQGNEEKDPYEVGWEDGENDPMNPKNKKKAMKWVIVLICATASLCV